MVGQKSEITNMAPPAAPNLPEAPILSTEVGCVPTLPLIPFSNCGAASLREVRQNQVFSPLTDLTFSVQYKCMYCTCSATYELMNLVLSAQCQFANRRHNRCLIWHQRTTNLMYEIEDNTRKCIFVLVLISL